MDNDRSPHHDLLEAVGVVTLLVIGLGLLERWTGWDPVGAAERLLREEADD